ncbi:MAG: class II glutamine amidotransferase [Deltaproteobacteria bacterium]|nr:class II glutamine amidotransferase [Deltaproteobacteria bacterium]
MCRMLALRSAQARTLAWPLLDAPDSLLALSHEHRHGWGLARYVGSQPVVVKGTLPAHEDPEFEGAGRSLEGRCLLAHIRKASVGSIRLENCHPFHFRRWVFAHNGTVPHFEETRERLDEAIDPGYLGLVRGDTDSERCFALFLTRLQALGALEKPPVEVLACALAETIDRVRRLSPDPATALTLMATDGESLVGVRAGDRELGFWGREGEHLLIASEPPSPDLPWTRLADGEIVAADRDLRLRRWWLAGPALSAR